MTREQRVAERGRRKRAPVAGPRSLYATGSRRTPSPLPSSSTVARVNVVGVSSSCAHRVACRLSFVRICVVSHKYNNNRNHIFIACVRARERACEPPTPMRQHLDGSRGIDSLSNGPQRRRHRRNRQWCARVLSAVAVTPHVAERCDAAHSSCSVFAFRRVHSYLFAFNTNCGAVLRAICVCVCLFVRGPGKQSAAETK